MLATTIFLNLVVEIFYIEQCGCKQAFDLSIFLLMAQYLLEQLRFCPQLANAKILENL